MKVEAIELDAKKRPVFLYQPIPLDNIPDPNDADLIVQLCQLQLIKEILNVWKEDIKETGIQMVQNAKYRAKKAQEQHYQELLSNLVTIIKKQPVLNFRWSIKKLEN